MSISPRPWKVFLLPIKKPIQSESGIIFEEDRGELLTDTYELMFDITNPVRGGTDHKAWERVICSDSAGINICVEWQMIKVAEQKDILGFII